MAVVDLNIGGRQVQLACGDGEEQRLMALAESVNNRMKALNASYGGTSDNILLVMTALTMQDEIAEFGKRPPASPLAEKENISSQYLKQAAEKINLLSDHAESLAEKLRKC